MRKWCLKYLDLKNAPCDLKKCDLKKKKKAVKCSLLFFRSFSLDFCGHLGKNSSHCQKFACSYRWRNDEGQGGSSRPVHNIFFGLW